MSVALVLRRNGSTWIASDSAMFNGPMVRDYGPKFAVRRGVGFAYAGSIRAWQAIDARHHEFDFKRRWTLKDAVAWAEWSRGMLMESGLPKEGEKGQMPTAPIGILLATPKRIFHVCGDGSAVILSRFGVIGAGRQVAIGVLYALFDWPGISTRDLAHGAVATTIRCHADVGGRPRVKRLG